MELLLKPDIRWCVRRWVKVDIHCLSGENRGCFVTLRIQADGAGPADAAGFVKEKDFLFQVMVTDTPDLVGCFQPATVGCFVVDSPVRTTIIGGLQPLTEGFIEFVQAIRLLEGQPGSRN